MRDFIVFSWNLQVFGTEKAENNHQFVAEKVVEGLKLIEEWDKKPFIGFFLEVMGGAPTAKKIQKLLTASINKVLKCGGEVNGIAIDCDASGQRSEHIVIISRKMNIEFSALDIRSVLEKYMIKDIVRACLNLHRIQTVKSMPITGNSGSFVMVPIKTQSGEIINTLKSRRISKPSSRITNSDYEEESTFGKLIEKDKKTEVKSLETIVNSASSTTKNHLNLIKNMIANANEFNGRMKIIEEAAVAFGSTLKGAEVVNLIVQNIEKGAESYYSSPKIQDSMKFCRDTNWYRNGVICRCSSVISGAAIRIAAIHAPGPEFSDVPEVPESIKEASFGKGIDILIGDLNVRNSLEDDNFVDCSSFWQSGTTISKTMMAFGDSKWDRILLRKSSGLSCRTADPLLPGFGKTKELSDHGLIIGYITRASSEVSAFSRLDQNISLLTKRKGEELDEDEFLKKSDSETGKSSDKITTVLKPPLPSERKKVKVQPTINKNSTMEDTESMFTKDK